MNILIPMGGRGQRFKNAGYNITKPLIQVNGKPMIQRVIENLNIDGKYIFLVSKEDNNNHNLEKLLPKFCGKNECQIILEDPNNRRGAAAACLLAEVEINTEEELIISNSDQLINWNPINFIGFMHEKNANGGIITFKANDPKWSFAKLECSSDLIIEVAEKNPISNNATVGIYWFKSGKLFVDAVKSMIDKNIKINGEYYTCPVYNEIIKSHGKIYNYEISKMHPLGTPEDLEFYLKEHK